MTQKSAMANLLAALLILLALAGLPGLAVAAPQDASAALVFGVVPQQSTGELVKAWTPILDYLGRKTGQAVRFATAKDIPTFEQRLAAGEYDITYMNPYHYTVFHRQPGYRLLAKEKGRQLKGIIVVRKDSPIGDIAQLKGETVAFPGPAAFAATLLPQAQLNKLGIPVVAKYVSSHDSVYLSVARGLYVAGGGIPRTFENLDAGTREQLRILWSTPGHTPHAIAIHPRVAGQVAGALQAALLSMADDPQGAALLKSIGFHALVAANDADYDNIRRLDFKQLEAFSVR